MNAAITPCSEAELQDVVKEAASQSAPFRISGGGTRANIGQPVAGQTLSTNALSGVDLYDPGALTLVVGAGTSIQDIEDTLAGEQQMLAFEPMDHRSLLGTNGAPTIGGVVAGNVSGPRRLQAGACRDALLGVRFVDGRGRQLKSGGRVMKNVTGLDLARLMCGAFGTLGVLSQVALKVLPRPERAATLVIDNLADAATVKVFCKALSTPFEVSGAASIDGRAYLRLEGLDVQVGDRLTRLREYLDEGGEVIDGDAHHALWRNIRDVRHFADTGGSIWRVSVKPTDAPRLLTTVQRELDAKTSLDWGGGLVWIQVPQETSESAAGVIRSAIGQGHATLIRASTELRQKTPVFQPESARLTKISTQLRAQFDPHNILNPGLMAA
ncbi:glycolate oxidase subunit GlcE [Pontibaca salina]|uniref:Glycolate oxidase subunit GlcE n=1 Tax=Pontibaca salina TaxID=2795731 RepID=A0A934HU84_9RHOB|nr:glycolate oxidase subunit GlcE [Pontibaca salina]MBI6630875.1 glycolate oxidase subunit GlcE [Pontibaca salina]